MVRPAALDDAAEIARVHVATWRSTYRDMLADDFLESLSEANYTERWRRVIGEGFSRVFVVDDPEGIVGFASGGRERAGEARFAGELYALYVLGGSQRSGHGRGGIQVGDARQNDRKDRDSYQGQRSRMHLLTQAWVS